jgi:hypothetical protein
VKTISLSTKHLFMRYAPARATDPRLHRAVRFCLRAWASPAAHREWFEILDRPELRAALAYSPRMCERVQRDYVSTQLSPAQRSLLLRKHFDLVCAMPAEVRDAVYSDAGFEVARFKVAEIEHVLKLQHVPGNCREGDLGLVWDCTLGRVATASFALVNATRGVRVMLVGGLQGGRGDTMMDMYKVLTRAMHGLRPMSALVHFLQMTAQALAADELLCVEDRAHIRFKPGKTKGKKQLEYDQVWQEHGGTAYKLGLQRVPVDTARRDLADVSSHKRSMYRKRYVLLDDVAGLLRTSMQWSAALPQPKCEPAASAPLATTADSVWLQPADGLL